MKATKKAADYERASVKGKNCGTCVSMLASGECRKVQGLVDRAHVCDLYSKKAK